VAALALAVDAVVQAEDSEDVVVELPREVARQLLLELGDVGGCPGVDGEVGHGTSTPGHGS
jgi:hypothetical protein